MSATAVRRLLLDPLIAVVFGVLVGIVVAAMRHAQPGLYVVAGALAVGAVLRLILHTGAAGSLVVRSRRVDVATLLVLAGAVALIAAVTPFPAGHS